MVKAKSRKSSPLAKFLSLLREAEVLSEEQFATAIAQGRSMQASPDELAGWLVREQWLTRFQAETLLAGGHWLRLGKYIVQDKLGSGGMGAVYRAIESGGMRRTVAIKTMAEHLLDNPESVARFRREMETAAALSHPNIIRIYDAESIGRRHYLVMEHAEGRDLESVLSERGPLPIAQACAFVRQAATGLAYAHERGMIHRDVKPQNLFLCEGADGRPLIKILDMGLAKFGCDADANLTGTGQLLGTPDYMAPEQIENFRLADPRADIYSLGCALFKLLTGLPPFESGCDNPMLRMMARLVQEPPYVRSLRCTVPASLNAIIRKMMAREPSDRYSSAAQVADALEPFTSETSLAAIDDNVAAITIRPRDDGIDDRLEVDHEATQATDLVVLDHELSLSARTDRDLEVFFQRISSESARSPAIELAAKGKRKLTERISWATVAVTMTVVSLGGLAAWQSWGETKIIFAIPANARDEVEIAVDGRPRRIPKTGPIVVYCPPGTRTLQLSRPQFEAIVVELTLSRGEARTFHPKFVAIRPADMHAPFSASAAATGRQAWSRFTGTPAKYRNSVGADFVLIPPGEFRMGPNPRELEQLMERRKPELDREEFAKWTKVDVRVGITIEKPFYLQTTETTVASFRKFVEATDYRTEGERNGKGGSAPPQKGSDEWETRPEYVWNSPAFSTPDSRPVVQVSWNDAVAFAQWLSDQEKRNYRLPTDAEWEYCCRAGTETAWNWQDASSGPRENDWIGGRGSQTSRSVGLKKENGFGLFDMHGNVVEWCADYCNEAHCDETFFDGVIPPHPNGKALRGGCWQSNTFQSRSAARGKTYPAYRAHHIGFRLAAEIQNKK